MTLSFKETQYLIELVLATDADSAVASLNTAIKKLQRTLPEFYDGVLKHGPKMKGLTSVQWQDFHRKVPHWRLLEDEQLMSKLSENQKRELGLIP